MDLPVTTPILNSRKIKILHLEPTNVCQAACPLCLRETDKTFEKNIHHHLTFEQILSVFDQKQIASLNKMFMCGNYGDPAAGQHTLDIFQKFRKINPTITLGMNTNGALQNRDWWKTLATILNQPKDYVVFSIDGLEDTNHIYRQHVSWKNLIANVKTFIAAGGAAHWDMLVYRHNEHQVELCEQYAKQLGFKWFRTKVSRRPSVNNIELPVNWSQPKIESTVISCSAINENSLYIDAQGNQYPCCWLGASYKNQIIDLLEIQKSWNSKNPIVTCQKTCGQKNQTTNFSGQWQKETELNV
jgi:sulfatase maturation enzyme AslB (radical SAM superfamily)